MLSLVQRFSAQAALKKMMLEGRLTLTFPTPRIAVFCFILFILSLGFPGHPVVVGGLENHQAEFDDKYRLRCSTVRPSQNALRSALAIIRSRMNPQGSGLSPTPNIASELLPTHAEWVGFHVFC